MNEDSNLKPCVKIKIDEVYENFQDFYQSNKNIIYKSIVTIFKKLVRSKKDELTLFVNGKILDLELNSYFIFSKTNFILLEEDLLPYFESIEDYTMCSDILKIIKKLKKINQPIKEVD